MSATTTTNKFARFSTVKVQKILKPGVYLAQIGELEVVDKGDKHHVKVPMTIEGLEKTMIIFPNAEIVEPDGSTRLSGNEEQNLKALRDQKGLDNVEMTGAELYPVLENSETWIKVVLSNGRLYMNVAYSSQIPSKDEAVDLMTVEI